MNSFRELLESPVETEETIRFRGIDWLMTPVSNAGEIPGFDNDLGEWIFLFVEIGGKKFLNHTDNDGCHIGHYANAGREGIFQIMIELGGVEWINKKDSSGCHIGFYSISIDHLPLLTSLGGPDWVNHKNHAGYCF